MTIVLLKDYFIFTWIRYKLSRRNPQLPSISSTDDDVIAEIDRVRNKSATEIIDSNLVLRGLTKLYGKHLAVNQLHVGVEPAECFGLLGVNGAGN
jgi:ATP-binding cassette subfamily A (ABC1) protein 3